MANSSEDSNFLFKVVLVGSSCCGKSQLLNRFCNDGFDRESKATIGVEFASKTITIQDLVVRLQIWDTSGTESYRLFMSLSLRGAVGFLVLFDITRRSSFDELDKWMDLIQDNTSPDTVVLCVGTKADLENLRAVTQEEAQQLTEARGLALPPVETSARTNMNVDTAFFTLTAELIRRIDSGSLDMTELASFWRAQHWERCSRCQGSERIGMFRCNGFGLVRRKCNSCALQPRREALTYGEWIRTYRRIVITVSICASQNDGLLRVSCTSLSGDEIVSSCPSPELSVAALWSIIADALGRNEHEVSLVLPNGCVLTTGHGPQPISQFVDQTCQAAGTQARKLSGVTRI